MSLQNIDIQDFKKQVSMLYVGCVIPDEERYRSEAFSRAGNMAQINMLHALVEAGLSPDLILSYRPIKSYPGNKKIRIKGERTVLEGINVHLLAFMNITPLKQILIGVNTFLQILKWGFRKREFPHRIVYAYNLTVPPGLFTFIASRIIGAKMVVWLNDINIPGETVPNTLFNKIDYYLHKKLLLKLDGYIPVADQMIKDFAPDKEYLRVEGGIAQSMLEKMEKAKFQFINSKFFTIVSVGNLDEYNGFHILLEAFSRLKGNYKLRIAGAGPLVERIKEASKKDSRIEYLGFVSMDKIIELYKTAELLINMRLTKEVNTSYFFPSKFMEYLLSGRPVISTCTGHIKEEYKDYVYLLEDETPEGLEKLISYVSALPLEERLIMGRKARDYMLSEKTWEKQGEKIVKYILKHVVKSKFTEGKNVQCST